MRARQPSIVHPFRGGMPSGKKIPVRDTAPQNSGPSLSPESGCSAPAGTALNSSSRRLNTSLFIPISRRRSPDQPLSSPPGDRRHGNARRAPFAFHRPEERAFGGWGEFEGGRETLSKGAPSPLKPSPCHKKRAVPRRERPVRHVKGWQQASSRRRRPPRRRGGTGHAARASSRRPCGSLPTGPPARSRGCCCRRSCGPSGRCG